MARLLQCTTCLSLEKLPDYDGPAQTDAALLHALGPHRFPDGKEHIGNLFVGIPDKALENMAAREQIEREIWGAKAEMASFKDTLMEDAQKCYSNHGRPKMGCIDYKDDKKRLGNPAKNPHVGKVFLCQFCPVESFVTSQIMSNELSVVSRVAAPRRRLGRSTQRRKQRR